MRGQLSRDTRTPVPGQGGTKTPPFRGVVPRPCPPEARRATRRAQAQADSRYVNARNGHPAVMAVEPHAGARSVGVELLDGR